jgi:tetratricopeptide (TPR) repeat protein
MVQAIDRAREKQERARLDAMPPAELKASARALLYEQKDAAAARRMLEALLERPLANPERGEALTELGIVHRAAQNLPASEQALQRAIDLTGIDSATGAEAAFQLAWTVFQDHGRALALFDSSARSQGAPEGLRLCARWNAAKLAQSSGDTARARADFTSLLRDCSDNEAYGYILEDVQARLKGM